jgi:predicted RNase H-like HicB family nuclease
MKKATSRTAKDRNGRATGALLAKAAAISAGYRLLITPRPDGEFTGCAVEMPLVIGRGKTEAACIADTRDALAQTVASYLERGETPPAPATDAKREVQLNIRLTPDERLRIEERARLAGFRSLADYVRRAALRGTG